jgi:hypothetical protein
MYVGAKRRVHEGKAMAVVRASGEKGNIVLHISAEGIPSVSVALEVK